MTTFLFVIGIALVGFTGRLVARAASVPRLHLKAHLRDLEDYGFTTNLQELDRSLVERLRIGLRNRAAALGLWLDAPRAFAAGSVQERSQRRGVL